MTHAIKIASFNLKHDFFWARKNAWQNRRTLVEQTVQRINPTILGVQELIPDMREDIAARLSGYTVWGQSRNKFQEDEQEAILFKRSDASVCFDEIFWLSKHPEKTGSRAYYSFFPRICMVCEAYINQLGTTVRVFNTHFDHVCGMARVLSVRIILEYMHQLNQREKLPTILMGDMNAHPNSKPIRILSQNLHDYQDIHLTNIWQDLTQGEIGNTYHGFHGKFKERGRPIDYIFISDEFRVRQAYIDRIAFDGRYPSDHYPLVADLTLV